MKEEIKIKKSEQHENTKRCERIKARLYFVPCVEEEEEEEEERREKKES